MSKKTFKDQREQRELHDSWRANREGRKEKERGGQKNLLKELETEEEELDDLR